MRKLICARLCEQFLAEAPAQAKRVSFTFPCGYSTCVCASHVEAFGIIGTNEHVAGGLECNSFPAGTCSCSRLKC